MDRMVSQVDIQSLLQRAVRLQVDGQLEKAAELVQEILQADPRNPHAWNLLGVQQLQKNQPLDALEPLNRAIEHGPRFADFHFNFAAANFQLEQWVQALSAYEKAAELN